MTNNFWKSKNVLVTGGAGFIGSHVVEKLVGKGANVTILDNLQNGAIDNLSKVKNDIRHINGDIFNPKYLKDAVKNQNTVLNLAARVGGIEYNRNHQATMMRDNLLIGTKVIEEARLAGVENFLVVSSACVYSRDCSIPTPESEGFDSEPEPTNGGYGWAKRMSEKLGSYYAEEFGMKVSIVRPYNCYGPRDHFDPKLSHVIPALIKRVFDGEDPISVWGTGSQTRAFLYVTDMADGMILAAENSSLQPVAINLGTDEEISIKDLIKKIIKLSGVKSEINFDTTKPDGSTRRNSDNTLSKKILGFEPKIDLDSGLRETISWYRSNNK